MLKIAIVGAGISGLSAAHFLKDRHIVTVFEKERRPGGLIRCEKVNGSLFHTCGGHVFNSRRQDVLDWFWSKFKKEEEFTIAKRNSIVYMENGKEVPYPIENNIRYFDYETQKDIISDLISLSKSDKHEPSNFEDFLKARFGNTLYKIYFNPYNRKVWQRNLKDVPITWLEGKLPMPTIEEIIFNNINHIDEKSFVHSSFWYERNDGSQFIADTLAEGLDIRYSSPVKQMEYNSVRKKWGINDEQFDSIVFCGNVKELIHRIKGLDVSGYIDGVDALEYHGTTTVFCEIDRNPYSWVYQPSPKHKSHRIICTGNFADSNNDQSIPKDRITASIEFTDFINETEMAEGIKQMPYHPKLICHKYNQYTYPVQNKNTRQMIKDLKRELAGKSFYLTGRFADWEYYNMDVAIGAAMDLCRSIK